MAHDWLPAEDVLNHVGVEADAPAAASVERARLAAAVIVERNRPDLAAAFAGGDDAPAVDDALIEGGVLLAARLHARKGSPAGIASYGEFGAAAVLRFDPDVAQLIGVGRYAKPAVG